MAVCLWLILVYSCTNTHALIDCSFIGTKFLPAFTWKSKYVERIWKQHIGAKSVAIWVQWKDLMPQKSVKSGTTNRKDQNAASSSLCIVYQRVMARWRLLVFTWNLLKSKMEPDWDEKRSPITRLWNAHRVTLVWLARANSDFSNKEHSLVTSQGAVSHYRENHTVQNWFKMPNDDRYKNFFIKP